MSTARKVERLFWLAVAFIVLASGTFLLMPLVNRENQNEGIWALVIGAVFWVSSIVSYTLLITANVKRKQYLNRQAGGDTKMNCLPGMISFFGNVPAIVSDVVMIASVLMLAVALTKWKYEYISYVLLFLFYLSLNLHGMFNGRIYKSIKIKNTRRDRSYE